MNHLTFQKFTEEILTSITSYLPEAYADVSIDLQRIPKPGNKILTAIGIRQPSNHTVPVIYLDDTYQKYCDGADMDAILSELADTIQKEMNRLPDMRPYLEWDVAKDLIVSRLINMQLNSAYIADRPVRAIENSDIGIIYDIELSHVINQGMTAAVTYTLMEQWGIAIQDLDTAARKNTPQLRPVRIQSLGQMLAEAIADAEPLDAPNLLYVITNTDLCQGAVAVTYPGIEDQLKKKLGDFYLIPSSTHEMLAVSQAVMEPEKLAEMIRDVNANDVAPEDVLDDVPYLLQDGCLIPVNDTISFDIPRCVPAIPFA